MIAQGRVSLVDASLESPTARLYKIINRPFARNVAVMARRAAPGSVVGSCRTVSAQFTASTEGWTATHSGSRVVSAALCSSFAVVFRGRCCCRNSGEGASVDTQNRPLIDS